MQNSGKFRVFFVPTANAGVNYYRLCNFAWQMRQMRNVETHVYAFQYKMNESHPWQLDMVDNPNIRREIEGFCQIADVVVWQPLFYGHSLEFFNDLKYKLGKPFLVETDDNFTDVPPWNEAFYSFAPGSSPSRNAATCISIADGLIVSTPHLKETYSHLNERCWVVPNSIDFNEWDGLKRRSGGPLRVGWIGGKAHVRDLYMIKDAVKELHNRHKDVRFYFVNSALKEYAAAKRCGYVFEGLPRVMYTDKSAPINLYPRFMSSFKFDIGLAPIEDCNFNRSKSNLRWLEYSALGIPTVASDMGEFKRTITHGVDGLLADNENIEDWIRNIELVIKQPDLRRLIGNNAYKKVKAEFNVRKTAKDYLNILRGICNEQSSDSVADRGSDERSESRPLHAIAN